MILATYAKTRIDRIIYYEVGACITNIPHSSEIHIYHFPQTLAEILKRYRIK